MKPEVFAELLEAANDALEHAKGKRVLKTTMMRELAPMKGAEVKQVRKRLQTSQGVFAHYLKVSPKTVQAWEANRRLPNGHALVLLRMMEKQPGLVDAVFATGSARSPQSASSTRKTASYKSSRPHAKASARKK